MKKIISFTLVLIGLTIGIYAQTPSIVLTTIATGITSPVCIANCGDDRIFFVQQTGQIKILKNGSVLPTSFLDVSSLTTGSGERGLLGLAFSPDYASDGYFYVNYTDLSGNSHVARYSVSPTNPDSALASSAQILFSVTQPYSNHNGGNVMFGPDGYLYAGFGDGGSAGDPMGNGQNKSIMLGKMLRIDVSGGGAYSIPPTNPFVGMSPALPEIWAYGLRNPWRFSFDRLTGDLWIGDVGQDLWEEVDMQPASSQGGENYGWKCYEGTHSYSTAGVCSGISGLTPPVYDYAHSTANGCSVTGGFVYRGAKYQNLYGKYIYAEYCGHKLYMLTKNGATYTNSVIKDTTIAFTAFGEDRYGELYVTDYNAGKIYSISDNSSCQPVADLNLPQSLTTCDSVYSLSTPYNPDMYYQWYFNGSPSGPNIHTYTATQDGDYYVNVTSLTNFCTANSDTVSILLNVPVTASFSGLDTAYCVNWSSAQLTGTPAGGTFSGPGVTGNIFNPALAGTGTHTITYSYTLNGCNASAQLITSVSACTGIDHLPNTSHIRIVPNPNHGTFTLNFFNDKEEPIEIIAENNLGQRVYHHNGITSKGDNAIAIDLGKASAGLYMLMVKKGGITSKLKAVVK